jgi:dTDP-4-dehydrorhamnose reductase
MKSFSTRAPSVSNAGTPSLLIIGVDGLIGSALAREADLRKIHWEGTSRRTESQWHLNLAESPDKWQIPSQAESAVLCAGITNVAYCENNPSVTRKINIDATLALASQLSKSGCKIVFLSSSQVFGPKISTPLDESTNPCPATEYGHQKAEAEKHILSLSPQNMVLRLPKVIHSEMDLISHWRNRWASGKSIEAYVDYYLSPISIQYLADSIMAIFKLKIGGTFHLGASDALSYYDFAKWIACRYGIHHSMILPSGSPTPQSPLSAILDSKKTAMLSGLPIPNSLDALNATFPLC